MSYTDVKQIRESLVEGAVFLTQEFFQKLNAEGMGLKKSSVGKLEAKVLYHECNPQWVTV